MIATLAPTLTNTLTGDIYCFSYTDVTYSSTGTDIYAGDTTFYDSTEITVNLPDADSVRISTDELRRDVLPAARSPSWRHYYQKVQRSIRASQIFTSVYFSPRYRARTKEWTGRNFHKVA